MLIFDRTKVLESIEQPVQTGYSITAEGQPVVGDTTGGVFGVRPAGSLAGEIFYGVAWNQQMDILALPYYETAVAPTGGGTVNLSRTQIYASSMIIQVNKQGGTAYTVITTGLPVAGTSVLVNLVNGTLTFASGDAGLSFFVGYRYAPSVAETLTVQGSSVAGGSAAFITGNTGVIRRGQVFTTEFDTSVDWSVANPVVRVLNGLFTIGASGAIVPNCSIVNVPTGSSTTGGGVNSATSVLGLAF